MAHAVVPKTDCPHLSEHFNSASIPDIDIPGTCSECSDSSENWICLQCYKTNCSRFVNQHASSHSKNTGHAIAASFSDLSIWCYSCESYIKHPTLQPILQTLHDIKFAPQGSSNQNEKDEETKSPSPVSETKEEENSSESDEDTPLISVDTIRELLSGVKLSVEKQTTCLTDLTVEAVAKAILDGKCKNIIVMTGAGISVAAGIPDFRTPGTGLYDNLQKYNLPYPTAVFEIDYFRKNPQPFYLLAKELYPGLYKPTAVHYFIKLLHQKGLLLRNFTQNIDTLERVAGIPGDALVEAHGSFASAHCIECKEEESVDVVREHAFNGSVPMCKKCNGLVKPDIVFFGESLPSRFFNLMQEDFPKCDLLIVIGTSLQVHPFASLINKVSAETPRLLINNEVVGKEDPQLAMLGLTRGFRFGMPSNYRDIALIGDCQDGAKKLAELLGWKDELEKMLSSPKL